MARPQGNPFHHKVSSHEQPMQSRLRRLRGRVSLIAGALLLLVLGVAYRQGTGLVSEGPLHSKHAFIGDDCAVCHAPDDDPTHVRLDGKTTNCLRCHATMNAEPHGDRARTRRLTTASAQRPAQRLGFVAWANAQPGGRRDAHAEIACTACHQEHRGGADLTAVTTATCSACHRNVFPSFDHGHPELGDLPARRPRQVRFDHATHYGRHFDKMTEQFARLNTDQRATSSCTACHLAPEHPEHLTPVVKRAEIICMTCHDKDVPTTSFPLLTARGSAPSAFAQLVEQLNAAGRLKPLGKDDLFTLEGLRAVAGADLVAGIGSEDLALLKADRVKEIAQEAELPPGQWRAVKLADDEPAALNYRTVGPLHPQFGHRDPLVSGWLAWLSARDTEMRPAIAGTPAAGPWRDNVRRFLIDVGAIPFDPAKAATPRCSKCHYVGQESAGSGLGDFKRPADVPPAFMRTFSHFIHARSGLAQAGKPADCSSCHQVVKAAFDPAGHPLLDDRRRRLETHRHAGDWQHLGVATCTQCHRQGEVSQACTTCHQYHQ